MTDIQSLIERVEKATCDDEAIFLDVARAILPKVGSGDVETARESDLWWYSYGRKYGRKLDCGAYESAALSLVSRALPGWFWSVSNAAAMPRANVWEPLPTRPVMGPFSSAPTPALAIILALLRAKAAEQENTPLKEPDSE